MSTQFFDPNQHLVFHSDKNGQMMSGGYAIQNLLFEKRVPLFAKWSGGGSSSGSSINSKRKHGNGDDAEHDVAVNIIPDKFSDLFKDLAVPAGLFMMPPLFRPRNYMYKADSDDDNNDKDDKDTHGSAATSESKQRKKHKHKHHNNDTKDSSDKDHYDMSLRGSDKDDTSSDDSHSRSDSGSDSDAADESKKKPYFRAVSSDMFDKLISLVSPTDRIKVDKRTRKHRSKINNNNNNDDNDDEDGSHKFHDKKQNRRRNNKTKRNTNA